MFVRLLLWGALLFWWTAAPSSPRLVVEPARIILASPNGYQTISMLDGGATGLYYDSATDLLRGRAGVRSVVLLGLGGGEMLRQAHQVQPAAVLVGVEIDPTTAHLARTVFAVPAAVVEADAIGWVDVPPAETFSVVMVDLYDDSQLVPAAGRLTFLGGCYRLLEHGGLLIFNVWPARKEAEVARVLRVLFPRVSRRTYGANVVLFTEKT